MRVRTKSPQRAMRTGSAAGRASGMLGFPSCLADAPAASGAGLRGIVVTQAFGEYIPLRRRPFRPMMAAGLQSSPGEEVHAMAEVLFQYDTPLPVTDGASYLPRACGREAENELWE